MDILNNNFYIHGISTTFNKLSKRDLILLKKILKSGYLYSRRNLKINTKMVGFNGLDYISLCDYSARNDKPYAEGDFYKEYTSYNTFVRTSISLMLKEGDYQVIKPELTYPHIFSYDDYLETDYLGRGEDRYSDLLDEVQVKDKISLKNLIGISLPITYTLENEDLSFESLYKYFSIIEKILHKNNFNIGIYDLDILEKINSDNFVKIYKK